MARMLQPTVATTSSRALLSACEQLGLDRQVLLAAAGLTAAEVDDPDGRLGVAHVSALWQKALELSGDPGLGLRIALAVPFGAYRVIDFLAASAPTVGEGLVKVARYFPLINAALTWTITHDASAVRMSLDHPGVPGTLPRAYAEYALAVTVLHCRHANGFSWPLVEVTFAFPSPPEPREYEHALGCPVRFGHRVNTFVLSQATWAMPSRASSSELLRTLEAHADTMLASLDASRVTSTRVARLIIEELEGGDPSLARVARRMALSPRSLQRRLAEEQTTFAEVLDQTRRHMAQAYINDRALALTEVAYLLGFSEHSAFSRACQRWFGQAPRQLRGQLT
jgi:AraC-like DNA-binding protein